MTTYPNIGLTLPTRGAPGSGLWGDTDDANTALLDQHDHSSGKGLRITTAAININADLSFSSLYAPTNLNRVSFAEIAALSSNNKSLFVNSADHELYWRSNAGANVKLTAGSALNVAAFTGGIGGDYTAVAAAVAYDDANKRYTFKEGTGDSNGWARLQSGPLRLLELGTSETVFVEQAAPGALAASYTITWPLALPATSQMVSISSSGQIAFADVATHGDRVLSFTAISGAITSGTGTYNTDGTLRSTAAAIFVWSIPLRTGDRIKSVTVAMFGDGAVDVTNYDVDKITAAGVQTSIGSTTVTNVAASWNDQLLDVTDTTLASGDSILLTIQCNASLLRVNNIRVTYDHP